MGKQVDFFFDIGSSYSYLAATQMQALAQRTGATVRWRPFLLGGVFKATGNGPPIQVMAKARWLLEDMIRSSRYLGVGFKQPSRFPVMTLRVQRALTAIERLTQGSGVPAAALYLFNAYWVDDRDPIADETIGDAARAAGLEPAQVIAAIDDPATKDALRVTTEEAIHKGAFGAPTFVIGDTLIWGHDRLHLVEAELKGE